MADDISISIRTRGGRQSAREADAAAQGIGRIGVAASKARTGLRSLDRGTRSSGASFGFLRNQAQYAGFAIGGIGVLAVKAGLQFNAFQEQSQVAFTGLLGSSQAARRELSFLQKTAATTPFELPQITQGARQLLAFGFNVKQANSLLGTMGDAAAGAGLGAEAIDQMVRAFGQIRGKGKLQAEELNQLGELGLVNREKLAKNLGITTAQLADAGNQGISSSKAIGALQKTLNDTFGGASAKQAKTFNGQLSTLHDNFNQLMGTVSKPAFDALRLRVFPVLSDLAKQLNSIWSGGGTTDDKMTASKAQIRRRLGPLFESAKDAIREMHLGQMLSDEFEAAAPVLMNAAGRTAAKAVPAFAKGFLDAGPYGKMFALAVIGSKLGAFSSAGRMAGGKFYAGFASRFGPLLVAYLAVKVGQAVANLPTAVAEGLNAQDTDPTVARGRRMAGDPLNQASATEFNRLHPVYARRRATQGLTARNLKTGIRLGDPSLIPGSPGVPSNYKPSVRAGRGRGGDIVIHETVQIDGKTVTKVVHRHATDAHASRRGG